MTPNKSPFSQSLAFYTETSHARIDWRGRERFRKDYAKTEDCVELYTSTLFIFPIKSIFPKCSNCSKKFLTNQPTDHQSPRVLDPSLRLGHGLAHDLMDPFLTDALCQKLGILLYVQDLHSVGHLFSGMGNLQHKKCWESGRTLRFGRHDFF